MIYDKRNAAMVLGCLLQQPNLLADAEAYTLTVGDFADRLHRILFSSIFNMFHNGVEDITVNEIHAYLAAYPELYHTFNELKGNEAILMASEIAELGNFKYYYDKLKKMSLLRSLEGSGFDVSPWYIGESYDISKRQELELQLEKATIQDIIQSYTGRIAEIETEYVNRESFHFGPASDGIADLVAQLKLQPEIGLKLQGDIFTTVTRGARKAKLYLASGRSGMGKALPNDTIIPTPNGDKTVGSIREGDLLFDRFGKSTKVQKIFPQGSKEVYRLTFSDGREALCNDEHLWSYWSSVKHNNLKTKTVREMLDEDSGNLKWANRWKYQMPIAQAVEYPEKEYFVSPYAFGLALGDGSFREQPSSKSFSFSSENIELPKALAEEMGYTFERNSLRNFTWTFKNNGKRVYVSEFLKEHPALIDVYSENKYIPQEYLLGSIKQRFDLLNGLLDSDGQAGEKGRVMFYTISEQLKNDFLSLTRSLGFIPTVNLDNRSHKYKKTGVCYTVILQGSVELKSKLFRLRRKRDLMEEYCSLNMRRERKDYINLVSIEKTEYESEMTCFMVDNEEHLFLTNDYLVTHNSRYAVGQACQLAYPIKWNLQKEKWEITGHSSRSLLITTELETPEIQTMVLAFLSGINEENILNGMYTPKEEERIRQAMELMEYYSDNLLIYHMPDPNTVQLNSNIRRLVITKKIRNVFYDYVHTSSQLLTEFSGMRIREDVALLLLTTTLKNLANELDVFMWSGTQTNANELEADFADESCIRGSRAVADKADFGSFLRPATPEHLKIIQPLLKNGMPRPNMFVDIYKNRRSKHKRVKLWMNVDLGTCRFDDLYLTSEYGELLTVDLIRAASPTDIPSIDEMEIANKDKIQPNQKKEITPTVTEQGSQFTV